jgi:hypothetical protein
MNKPQNNKNTIEDQLADFTDKILEENKEEELNLTSLDPELRSLQQTILRLKSALPEDSPSEAVIQRMRQNVIQRWQQQEKKASEPFWNRFLPARKSPVQKWQSQESRRRQSLAISLAAGFFLLLVSIPLVNNVTSAQPAASGQNLNVTLFIALGGGLFLLILWFFHRKR